MGTICLQFFIFSPFQIVGLFTYPIIFKIFLILWVKVFITESLIFWDQSGLTAGADLITKHGAQDFCVKNELLFCFPLSASRQNHLFHLFIYFLWILGMSLRFVLCFINQKVVTIYYCDFILERSFWFNKSHVQWYLIENMKQLFSLRFVWFWSKSISEKEFYPDGAIISSYCLVLDIFRDFTWFYSFPIILYLNYEKYWPSSGEKSGCEDCYQPIHVLPEHHAFLFLGHPQQIPYCRKNYVPSSKLF